jgi:4-coumarate--CoA ligase
MATVKIDQKHIVKSPWKDVQIPDTDIYTFMFHREEVGSQLPVLNPDRVVFIDGPSGVNMTFRQLKLRVELLSRGLAKGMNIKTGDKICFFMPNHVPISPSLSFYPADKC